MNITYPDNKTYALITAHEEVLNESFWKALANALPADHHAILHAGSATAIVHAEALVHLVEQHRAGGHSLIAVVDESLLDAFEEGFPVVPTLHEAEDFLEMEDIERQLGL